MSSKDFDVVGSFLRAKKGEKRRRWRPHEVTQKKGKPKKKKLKIFLSYAHEDIKEVEKIFHLLSACKTTPWLDKKNLKGGQDWEFEIDKAIKSSDAFIAFLSTRSVTKRGYVQKELKEGLDTAEKVPVGDIFVIPIRLDECRPPVRLEHLHYINWFTANGVTQLKDSLKLCAERLNLLKPE